MKPEILEKIEKVKTTMDELGGIHDEIIDLLADEDAGAIEEQNKWYKEYDKKTSLAIKEARNAIEQREPTPAIARPLAQAHVKLAKLAKKSLIFTSSNMCFKRVQNVSFLFFLF